MKLFHLAGWVKTDRWPAQDPTPFYLRVEDVQAIYPDSEAGGGCTVQMRYTENSLRLIEPVEVVAKACGYFTDEIEVDPGVILNE